jgi:5'-methylthioadenosine phosphorylase
MERIGVIGGSGLYQLDGARLIKKIKVTTPFGEPSDKYVLAKLGNREVVFLPRHGVGHRINPSNINYRANIYGMKKLGVSRIISVSACGSLKENIKPMDFLIPDQFLDRMTQGRKQTFFDNGIVAHVGFAHPVCAHMAALAVSQAKKLGLTVHSGGTYVNMEGPQFSTLAESKLYRSWGMDIIGMTNMVEARLAREAEICYVTLAAVTDYDCWHPGHASVTVEMIIANLTKNVENARKIIRSMVEAMPEQPTCDCQDALKYAIITDRKTITAAAKKRISVIAGKYF